jgi:hypothetical protein
MFMENLIYAVGRIDNANRRLAQECRERKLKINYNTKRGRLFIKLDPLSSTVGRSAFDIPAFLFPYLRESKILMHSTEQGGNTGSTREAIITCGLSGKPIRAYWVAKTLVPCGIHAKFTVTETMATVHAVGGEDRTSITVHRHVAHIESEIAVIITEINYQWNDLRFIPRYHAFEDAAQAAADKAEHLYCIEPHYINST